MSYRQDWMTDDQWECAQMLADMYQGFHHLHGRMHPCGPSGIEFNATNHRFSTYDFDQLTVAVFMAHDRCIRFMITSSGPRMLKLLLHKRKAREGMMHERHPTVEDALRNYRQRFPTLRDEGRTG